MLIKEYRICMPMTVEDYRIAQLYMIQKKSREESTGAESGVEILTNEPYEDGPGGKGQYTFKIYHIGSHLPAWFRNILPRSALRVEEEAWNAYPYTKTKYRVPFVEKFSIEVETKYVDDAGEQDDMFEMTDSERQSRSIDILDMVADPISSGDYKVEEDPRIYVSTKTGRGPLSESWRNDWSAAQRDGGTYPPYLPSGAEELVLPKRIMCAYKLCKVEFKYWGMQSKIERFIHDIALRKTMLRAHRQAWCWQDEWYGLTMEDIRALEAETARALSEKMAAMRGEETGAETTLESADGAGTSSTATTSSCVKQDRKKSLKPNDRTAENKAIIDKTHLDRDKTNQRALSESLDDLEYDDSHDYYESNTSDILARSLLNLEAHSESDDEFYDAPGPRVSFYKDYVISYHDDDVDAETASFITCRSLATNASSSDYSSYQSLNSLDVDQDDLGAPFYEVEQHSSDTNDISGRTTPTNKPRKTVLFLVVHGGSLLDTCHEYHNKNVDISNLRNTLENVIRDHYPSLQGCVAVRLVACPSVVSETLQTIASLSPYAFDMQGHLENVLAHDFVPLGTIPLFFTSSPNYDQILETVSARLNSRFAEFLRSDEGCGFTGSVCIVGDSTGAILAYDLLCRGNQIRSNEDTGSRTSLQEESDGSEGEELVEGNHSAPDCNTSLPHNRGGSTKSSASTATGAAGGVSEGPSKNYKLDFEVNEFFMLGSPLALVLAFRKACLKKASHSAPSSSSSTAEPSSKKHSDIPSCHQVYNLFHLTDPCSFRVEPLLHPQFRHIAPPRVPRFNRYPLGDGQPMSLVETLVHNSSLFTATTGVNSSVGITVTQDTTGGPDLHDASSNSSDSTEMALSCLPAIRREWWGNKRVDFGLNCPDALQAIPIKALPHLLHASYWESTDAAAFIVRQLLSDFSCVAGDSADSSSGARRLGEASTGSNDALTPAPRAKWKNRGNSIKLKSASPNHRANDVMVLEDQPRILSARFMYGPLDMLSLSGEMVDVHVMCHQPNGNWEYLGTEVTDNNGRVQFRLPESKRLSAGMYPVKMVVRADHSSVDFTLAILPPSTEAVVFSVDGSFAASVSIMGKDPKVRPGGVDVVRHWQDLGYLLVYITARPDMQQRRVINWLAHHNFPHGMVFFMDGIRAEPLRQKTSILQKLVNEIQIKIHCAYGSAKDINIYRSLDLQPNQIFAIGKASKKHIPNATLLSTGYAAHLNDLVTRSSLSRPALGAAQLMLRKACFELPRKISSSRGGGGAGVGGCASGGKRGSALSSTAEHSAAQMSAGGSLEGQVVAPATMGVVVGPEGNTLIEPIVGASYAQKPRGLSPRLHLR